MPNDYVELFWTLLESGNFNQLKKSIPKDFCWSILHPDHSATILVVACNHFCGGYEGGPTEKDVLDMVGWLVRSGASYTQKCGAAPTSSFRMSKSGEQSLEVPYAHQSVLSYIQAWQWLLYVKPAWKPEFNFLRKVLDRIAEASSEHMRRKRASIDEGIVEIWEKFLQASESHDLTIQTRDGCVTCHGQMLMQASSVVRAMLSSPMKEGTSQKVQLHDASSSAVQLFVEILYTCSSQRDEINWKDALSALDLAHRWQVEAVVAILADLLQAMITEESFSAMAEQAALKGLDQLKQRCQKFGAENATIREQIKKGQLPAVVQMLFQADTPEVPPPKKQRFRRL